MTLKVGYNLFAGASQAGTNDGTPGTIQAEVDENKTYHMRVVRLSDNQYYNATTKAFQAGAPAQADEILMQGSDSQSGGISYQRRLMDRIPYEALEGIDSDGCTVTVYPDSDLAGGVALTLAFKPDA